MIHMGLDVWFVPRNEWGARPPRSVTWFTPSYGSTTHWEGPHMGEFSHEVCAEKVCQIQNYHMDSKGWQDIAYTSVHCPHGYVYEGRWIGVRTAANGTSQGNSTAYATCYLGGEGDPFTEQGERSIRLTQDYLDQFGSAGLGRNCHRDWKSTACPGDRICTWVKAGQPIIPYPTFQPEPTPIELEDDMPYVLSHPNGVGFLITADDAVVLDADTAARYVAANFKHVALSNAEIADAIIISAQTARGQRQTIADILT